MIRKIFLLNFKESSLLEKNSNIVFLKYWKSFVKQEFFKSFQLVPHAFCRKVSFQELFQEIVSESYLFMTLKSDSHLPKKFFIICFNDSPSKMMKNAFLFHLKSSFHSQHISFFILTFCWACRKNSLIRKTRLIWNFMTSQSG